MIVIVDCVLVFILSISVVTAIVFLRLLRFPKRGD